MKVLVDMLAITVIKAILKEKINCGKFSALEVVEIADALDKSKKCAETWQLIAHIINIKVIKSFDY